METINKTPISQAWNKLKRIVQRSGKSHTLSVDEFLKERKKQAKKEGL